MPRTGVRTRFGGPGAAPANPLANIAFDAIHRMPIRRRLERSAGIRAHSLEVSGPAQHLVDFARVHFLERDHLARELLEHH